MKKLLILLIKGYQKFISPMLLPRCIYSPTCSQYMLEAVTKYGALKGGWLGIKRICRCPPAQAGGYDPEP